MNKPTKEELREYTARKMWASMSDQQKAEALTEVDPDWRDHFLDVDAAGEFYGLEGAQ